MISPTRARACALVLQDSRVHAYDLRTGRCTLAGFTSQLGSAHPASALTCAPTTETRTSGSDGTNNRGGRTDMRDKGTDKRREIRGYCAARDSPPIDRMSVCNKPRLLALASSWCARRLPRRSAAAAIERCSAAVRCNEAETERDVAQRCSAQCCGGPVPWRAFAVAGLCRGGPVPWRASAVAGQCRGGAPSSPMLQRRIAFPLRSTPQSQSPCGTPCCWRHGTGPA